MNGSQTFSLKTEILNSIKTCIQLIWKVIEKYKCYLTANLHTILQNCFVDALILAEKARLSVGRALSYLQLSFKKLKSWAFRKAVSFRNSDEETIQAKFKSNKESLHSGKWISFKLNVKKLQLSPYLAT